VKFHVLARHGDRQRRVVGKVGVGSDGTLWMEPSALEITRDRVDEVLEDLRGFPRPALLTDDTDGRVYVNVQAFAETRKCPEERKRMLARVDVWLDWLHPTNHRR
jgi:hypothetical protein